LGEFGFWTATGAVNLRGIMLDHRCICDSRKTIWQDTQVFRLGAVMHTKKKETHSCGWLAAKRQTPEKH